MTEAKMQTKFTRWLRDNWDDGAGAFELKVGKGNVVAFSCVPEHQILSLMRVRGIERLGLVEAMVHKLSDSAIGFLPFDCFAMVNCEAYLVLGFNGGKDVYMVDVVRVVEEMYLDGVRKRGSLGIEWAKERGERIVL